MRAHILSGISSHYGWILRLIDWKYSFGLKGYMTPFDFHAHRFGNAVLSHRKRFISWSCLLQNHWCIFFALLMFSVLIALQCI